VPIANLDDRTLLMSIPSDVEELIGLYPTEVRALALAARELITRVVVGGQETVDRTAKVIGYGYGPGYKDTICTLIMSKRGVKLGIVRGSELPDPDSLLQGSGKVHRYIPLQTVADVKHPGVEQMIRAGLVAWKQRTESTSRPNRRSS
jgi:hypothetical protein